MSNWFADRRQDWIAEMLQVYRFINRKHLMRKFDISEQQAALDLRTAQKRLAPHMIFNSSTKRYEWHDEEHGDA